MQNRPALFQITRFFRFFAAGPSPNSGPEGVTRTLTGTSLTFGHSKVRHRSCSLPDNPTDSPTAPAPVMKQHNKARCPVYPRSENKRFAVPDDKVPWSVPYPEYAPVDFTSDSVLKMPVWADVDFRVAQTNGDKSATVQQPKWNQLDGKVNRRSHTGKYEVVNSVPRNPVGRTGLTGRGCLGRWGPNHAADPIVTRWKRNEKGEIVVDDNHKLIAQFIAVQRRDNGQWALPGVSLVCQRKLETIYALFVKLYRTKKNCQPDNICESQPPTANTLIEAHIATSMV
ncbi:ADP-ribose pyrophosphatase, mitochondrial [Elysia marginata]|uniref:ADP-ribose pyrophosphatase, mitochondrial n=1 Tax=Elysia marginata TaxID=1093978 RepID=A0AAV4JGH2_9GAST|nr:ADP-ribose pyrophosphatase, mitochondrial [Elysia marginata]